MRLPLEGKGKGLSRGFRGPHRLNPRNPCNPRLNPSFYFSGVSECEDPQRPSCSIQRMTYEGMFSIATRFEAPHKNSIASRSTNVTFDISTATLARSDSPAANAFSSSVTYSLVNFPHK